MITAACIAVSPYSCEHVSAYLSVYVPPPPPATQVHGLALHGLTCTIERSKASLVHILFAHSCCPTPFAPATLTLCPLPFAHPSPCSPIHAVTRPFASSPSLRPILFAPIIFAPIPFATHSLRPILFAPLASQPPPPAFLPPPSPKDSSSGSSSSPSRSRRRWSGWRSSWRSTT